MAIFNKVLNVLILILAILACASSIMLSQKRTQIVSYNESLSEAITQTAEKINTTTNLKVKGLTADELTFKKHQEDNSATEKNVAQLVDSTTKIIDAKDALSTGLISVAETLNVPDSDKLKKEVPVIGDTSTKAVEKIKNHVVKIDKHQKTLINTIVESSEVIGKTVTAKGLSDIEKESYVAIASTFTGNVKELKTRTDKLTSGYSKSIKSLQDGFPQYNFKTSLEDMQSGDNYKVEVAVNTFYRKDMKTIISKLNKFVKSERTIALLKSEVLEKSEAIANLNKSLGETKDELGTKTAEVARLSKRVKAVEVRYGVTKPILPADVVADIIQTNDQWDFVILNKGKDSELTEKGEMIIHRDGELVCKIRISKVHENMAVADIINPALKVTNPMVGDKAIVQP